MGSGYEMGGRLDIDIITPEIEEYFEQIFCITDLDVLKNKFGLNTYPRFTLDTKYKEIEMEWDTAHPDTEIECLKVILEFLEKQGAKVNGVLKWEETCDLESFGRYLIEDNKIKEQYPEIVWMEGGTR